MYEKFDIETGKLLAIHRKKMKISQGVAAKYLGKSQSWLCDVEHGRSSLLWTDFKKLCYLYEINIDKFTKDLDDRL